MPWRAATGLVGGGFGPMLSNNGRWMANLVDLVLLGALATSVLILLLSVVLAGWRVKRVLRIEAAGIAAPRNVSDSRQGAGRLPGLRDLRRRRWLATNPARWLFAYAKYAGSIRWGWGALVFGSGLLAALAGQLHAGTDWSVIVALQPLVLAVGASLAAAASFRREIEEGTLELLLVTGLPSRQLVSGRIAQLWGDSAPAVGLSALFMLFALGSGNANGFQGDMAVLWICGALSVFGAVPIGARYAVRRLNPLHGWFWTVLTTGFPPLLIGGATATMFWGIRRGGDMSDPVSLFAYLLGFAVTQFALARTWFWLSANDLHTRLFMLKPFQRQPR